MFFVYLYAFSQQKFADVILFCRSKNVPYLLHVALVYNPHQVPVPCGIHITAKSLRKKIAVFLLDKHPFCEFPCILHRFDGKLYGFRIVQTAYERLDPVLKLMIIIIEVQPVAKRMPQLGSISQRTQSNKIELGAVESVVPGIILLVYGSRYKDMSSVKTRVERFHQLRMMCLHLSGENKRQGERLFRFVSGNTET